MESKKYLIANPHERQLQREAVERRLLRFLREHIYSTLPILQEVACYKSSQGTRQALKRLEAIGYVRHYLQVGPAQRLFLWGITHAGQAAAFDLETELPVSTAFEPSKIAYSSIPHHLDLQKLRVAAEQVGWTQWVQGDRLGVVGKDGMRPDAIAKDPSGNQIAIECERTIKSPQRIKFILSAYLQAIRKKEYFGVVWVSPNDDISRRLKKIILTIDRVPVDGQSVPIDPGKHHQLIHFSTYNNWPSYDSN